MTEYVQGIDVASYQSSDLTQIIDAYQPGHVVVRLYIPGEYPKPSHSLAQIASARQNGTTVGGYIWGYRTFSPEHSIAAAVDLCRQANLLLPILWIDCETYGSPVTDPGPDAEWLRRAKASADLLGMKLGIYTGVWWADSYFPGGQDAFQEFADWPLWLADYRAWSHPSAVPKPRGFHDPLAGWQYSGTGVDRDLFDKRWTVYTVEQPEPCGAELAKVARVQAIADAKPYRPPSKRKLMEALRSDN